MPFSAYTPVDSLSSPAVALVHQDGADPSIIYYRTQRMNQLGRRKAKSFEQA
jgi:hypothetical protein